MTRLTKYTIHLISGLLLALLTAGCVADRNVSDCITEGEDVELEFAVQVPALETSLRQLDATQEQAVRDIQLFVFNTQDESGQDLDEANETFAYEAEVKSKTQEGNTILIRCALKASSKPMRVVCIANAPTKINTTGFTNKTKQTILEDDQMKKNFTAAWPTDGSKFIPMWGESDKQPVSRNTKFNSCDITGLGGTGVNKDNEGVIHLVRALARIDVGVSFENDPASEKANGNTDFKIQSVRVYRYATSMYMTGTQSTTFYFNGTTREAKPHTPEHVAIAEDASHLKFEAAKGGVNGYVRNIYIPEISNQGDKNKRTCLVIGGYYNNSDKETFYRVDFIHTDKNASGQETTKQLDVLRNHRYRFNITKIKGPGTSTPGEALITEPVNITCDVIVWDEAKIDEIKYDGQYYLAVSKDKFHFGKDATSENITIRTNWPQGYKIVDETGKVWATSTDEATANNQWVYFTANDNQKLINQDMSTTLNVLDNKTGADREIPYENKKLFVQAGRIKWPLKVTQSYKTEIDITLYEQDKISGKLSAAPISHLKIEQGNDNAKLVAVRYTKGASLERLPLTAREQFIWERIDDNSEPGKALYRVTMVAGTAGKEDLNITEVSRFRITKDGAEDYADLSVYYMNYNAVPYRDHALTINMTARNENYVLINVPANFYIKANAPYKLEIVDIEPSSGSTVQDETMVVHDWKKGLTVRESDGMITGEPIKFQPFDWVHGENYNGKTATTGGLYAATISFRITSTDPAKHFKPVEFAINLTAGILQPEANCYIMKSTQKVPILIPLSRINTAADWYKQWEEEAEKMAKDRIGIAYKAGITQAQYNQYVNDGKSALPRLEDGDTDVEAALIWSTIRYVTSRGTVKDSGISILKTVVVDGKNYLMVALADDLDDIDEGNALVGVRRPSTPNEFLWSWHIWVVKEYPWLPLSSYSPGIFMNRNLGARAGGHGLFPGETNLIYTGLFYQFGRKDPFYADDFTGGDIIGKIPSHKIYLGSQTFKSGIMTDQQPKYGKAKLDYNKLYTMKQLIRYPYKIAGHDANEEYIVEAAGPNRGCQLGTVLWQGDPIYTRHDQLSRDQIALRTKKTPFDPSPYGWKVPSVGQLEMFRCFELDPLYFVNNGFIKATGLSLEYVGSNIVHLHTATTDIGSEGNAAVFNNGAFMLKPDGRKWQQEFNTSAFYPNAPASALPVRSVVNERETDFKKYTEEGFYDRSGRYR